MTLEAAIAEAVRDAVKEALAGVAATPLRMALTVSEAAEELRIGETMMRKLLNEGVIPYRKIGDRRIIARSALQAYLEGEPWQDGPKPGIVEDTFQRRRGRTVKDRSSGERQNNGTAHR